MIETERLVLRPWQEADKPAFDAIINTPVMMEHFGGVKPRADMDLLIDRQIAAQAADGHCMWAVETKVDGALAGICGVRISNLTAMTGKYTPVDGMYELGWRIAERHWGQGIAREAAEASRDWTFANTPAATVAAWTNADNTRSWGLMRRIGMDRREDLDFWHPMYAVGEPLGRMIVYAIDRP